MVIPAVSFASATGTENRKFSFNGHVWGDTKASVIAIEGPPDDDEVGADKNLYSITYHGELHSKDTLLVYQFTPDGLDRILQLLLVSHDDVALYINDYYDVRSWLVEMYGDPVTITSDDPIMVAGEDLMWDSDAHKIAYENDKATALLYGYLNYYCWFRLQDAVITLRMSSESFNINIAIDYDRII